MSRPEEWDARVEAILANTEPPLTEDDVERVWPPPTEPMAVARKYVFRYHTDSGGFELLRHHRGSFYRYVDGHWPELEPAQIRAGLYWALEHATFEKGSKLAAWKPTARTIGYVLDALAAVCHLSTGVEAPAWLEGHGPYPASELRAMGNGLLHLPSRTLVPHDPRFWAHQILPFDFDPDAPEPQAWLAFLSELWGDDTESINTLAEIMGYALTLDTRQQKMFMIVGPKRSGKGTIGRVVKGLLGSESVAAPTLASLAANFGLSPLIGRPLGIISDARLGGKVDSHTVVERLLSVSGEDAITVDRKYRDPWTGQLPTRFLILTNELPRFSDTSGALASRFIILVLTRSFYGREDPGLTDRLLKERSGILAWALEGLDRLRQRGHFGQPRASRGAVSQLEDLGSPVAAFIRDICVTGPGHEVAVDVLYREWTAWCEHQGTKHVTNVQTFGRDLTAALPGIERRQPRINGTQQRWYRGIGIRDITARPDVEEASATVQVGLGAEEVPPPDGPPPDTDKEPPIPF